MNYEVGTGMAGEGNRAITAFFDERSKADEAVERLVAAGIRRAQIRIVAGNRGSSRTAAQNDRGGGGFWDTLADLFMPNEDR